VVWLSTRYSQLVYFEVLDTGIGIPLDAQAGPHRGAAVGDRALAPLNRCVACYTEITMADLTAHFSMMMRQSRLPTRWVGG